MGGFLLRCVKCSITSYFAQQHSHRAAREKQIRAVVRYNVEIRLLNKSSPHPEGRACKLSGSSTLSSIRN